MVFVRFGGARLSSAAERPRPHCTRKGTTVESERTEGTVKEAYVAPQVLETYSKQELSETIRPHGPLPPYGDRTAP